MTSDLKRCFKLTRSPFRIRSSLRIASHRIDIWDGNVLLGAALFPEFQAIAEGSDAAAIDWKINRRIRYDRPEAMGA